jgi:hypothetical protein
MAIALRELEAHLNPGLSKSVLDATVDAIQKLKDEEGITNRRYRQRAGQTEQPPSRKRS